MVNQSTKNFLKSNAILLALALLTSVSSCKKDPTSTDLTAYPADLVSTPIVTSNFPASLVASQTPINIVTSSAVIFHSADPILHYGSISLSSILNNAGENLKVSLNSTDKANNYVTISGKKYNLSQFHFHYKSEHTINGTYSTMEIHFVNVAADNSYAVLGVMVDLGTGNASLQELISNSPVTSGGVNSPNTTFNLAGLFPANTAEYYTYSGSLTTPNFGASSAATNGGPVTWIVFKNKQSLSTAEYNDYKAIYIDENFREIQPLNARKLYINPGN
jgi:carbonic anhydrase